MASWRGLAAEQVRAHQRILTFRGRAAAIHPFTAVERMAAQWETAADPGPSTCPRGHTTESDMLEIIEAIITAWGTSWGESGN